MTITINRRVQERINLWKKRKHTDTTYDDMEKINHSDLINATRLLKRQKRKIEAVKRLHESCGRRSPKRLINLKRLGLIKVSNLPSHFLSSNSNVRSVWLARERENPFQVWQWILKRRRSSPNGKWFTWTRVENFQLDPLEAFIIIRSSLTERMARRSSSATRKRHIFL